MSFLKLLKLTQKKSISSMVTHVSLTSARLHPLSAVQGPCEAPPAGDAGPASSQLRH